eukprot:7770911-Pyramimonas_sp.AAC.1
MQVYTKEGRMLRKEVAMARRAVQEGKALCVVVNKADIVDKGEWGRLREQLQSEVEAWFPQ